MTALIRQFAFTLLLSALLPTAHATGIGDQSIRFKGRLHDFDHHHNNGSVSINLRDGGFL